MVRLKRRSLLGKTTAAVGGWWLAGGERVSADREELPDRMAFEREIPHLGAYDVVVCGGGPSGLCAALAARREGAHVLLIDNQAQLGGWARRAWFHTGWGDV